ncbi:hypothetical protein [Thermomonospora umbrina]|uniref:Uncharacterized protein n=1 Tax=Thermomonospora umbrina TaxID=111806 RepID=A0A3D9SVE9_9ACTN|nr:hypothetical protein [Thermomonospora umbrina]REE99768.1 hypothetical protein DFJ69_5284 [Thermomonospora umbrina]
MKTSKTVTAEGLAAAERFLHLNARVLERRRFQMHFRGGGAAALVAALRPYENADGGYGNALEPDLRGDASQPVPAQHALEILHEAGHDDDPAVGRLCDHLTTITAADGGVPFVLPTVRQGPHAPWWQTPDDPPGSLVPTATLAGQLHRAGSAHPWLPRATAFCWEGIDALTEVSPYVAYAILAFLDHVPERARAEAAFERLRGPLLDGVTLDPRASGEVHQPLDYAASPDGFARRLFDDDVIEEHLDALVDAQDEDGGWHVNFLIWTPITGHEWRGVITVERLRTLRAYGRFS